MLFNLNITCQFPFKMAAVEMAIKRAHVLLVLPFFLEIIVLRFNLTAAFHSYLLNSITQLLQLIMLPYKSNQTVLHFLNTGAFQN